MRSMQMQAIIENVHRNTEMCVTALFLKYEHGVLILLKIVKITLI